MISINDLHKTYVAGDTEVKALRGVSLNIDKGEFISLAGPSGSGKTTMLNIIGCIDSADSGDVTISGTSIMNLKKDDQAAFRRDNLGFVFQSYNLIPVLSVEENVEYIMLLQGVPPEKRHERVGKVLAELGLELGRGRLAIVLLWRHTRQDRLQRINTKIVAEEERLQRLAEASLASKGLGVAEIRGQRQQPVGGENHLSSAAQQILGRGSSSSSSSIRRPPSSVSMTTGRPSGST